MSAYLTDPIYNKIRPIVSIYETGRRPSAAAYSTANVLNDAAGITYGIHQSTAVGGLLDAILRRYLTLGGTSVKGVEALLPRLGETVTVNPKALPQWVKDALLFLAAIGQEPIMQRAQEEIFYESCWLPVRSYAQGIGLVHPLSQLILYDTRIHSGISRLGLLRARFVEVPPSKGGEEKPWSLAFAKARRDWLAGYLSSDPDRQALIRRTVYRVDDMLRLCAEGHWDLEPPFMVRSFKILK